jgi:hypothetical protein
MAANTFMRSIFGGIFPLFALYMFEGMLHSSGFNLLSRLC